MVLEEGGGYFQGIGMMGNTFGGVITRETDENKFPIFSPPVSESTVHMAWRWRHDVSRSSGLRNLH